MSTVSTGASTAQPAHLVPTDAGKPVLAALCDSILVAQSVTLGAAQTLIGQPAFTKGLVPTLPQDQALAASHAETYQAGWGAGIGNGLFEGLDTIADGVLSTLDDAARPLAAKLDATAPTDPAYAQTMSDFRDVLSALQATATSLEPNSGSTLLGVQGLVTKLSALSGQVGDDATRIASVVAEVDREEPVRDLTDRQQALQDKLADINRQIADGATSQILPSIEFGIKLGANVLEGELTAGVVVGAGLEIAGEAQEIQKFNAEVAALYKSQAQTIQDMTALADKIAADNTDLLMLSLTAAQVQLFNAQLQTLLADVTSVVDGLAAWNAQIGELALASDGMADGYFTGQVESGAVFWTALRSKLARYLGIIAASGKTGTPPQAAASAARVGAH